MVSSLKPGKSETMRAAISGLLGWFLFLMAGECLAVRLAEAQSKTDSTARVGCTSPNASQVQDSSAAGLQGAEDAEHQYARGLQLMSSGDLAGAQSEFKAALAAKPTEGRYVRELA